MKEDIISLMHITNILTSIVIGTLARLITLKQDYRQYPSFPNGSLIHIITGFVAAALGGVAIPALMTKNFVAVTFLALAIQQFREVRKMERDSLKDLENTEFTPRGEAYIDGISKTFEARNYISFMTALATSFTMQIIQSKFLWINILSGSAVGLVAMFVLKQFSKGKTVGDIADVEIAQVSVKNSDLYVEDIFVANLLGTENSRKLVEKDALAAIISPREEMSKVTLDNFGQRQAILFEVCKTLGTKRYSFTRKDFEKGRIAIAVVPILNKPDAMVEAIKKTPLLENTKKSDSVMKVKLGGA